MTTNTWQKIIHDSRVWLGPLSGSRTFRDFVEITVPEIIGEFQNETATFRCWIKVQHEIAKALSEISEGTQNKAIAISLSGHENVELFLLVHDTTEEGYALQMRGLFEKEYREMCDGTITIETLFTQNPVAFFGPLLRRNEHHIT